MICRKRKLVFVHIPKTGGTSVEDALWPGPRSEHDLWAGFIRPGHNKYQTGGLQHLTARLVRKAVGRWTFHRCYRFAVVRDRITLPHANKSIADVPPADWVTLTRADVSQQELDTISRIYRQDFELLGYPLPQIAPGHKLFA